VIESAGHQLWLEIRRNEYRWFFLVIAIGTGLALTDRVSGSVVFWTDVTLAWRDALFVLGPWTGAAAAWTAGRERRHGLDELLRTTARSPFRRRFWSLAAVMALGLLAFGLIGGWLALSSVQRVAWSGIDWGVILIAVMAIASAALFGFAFGAWKPRRATAFATMIGFSIIQLILFDGKGWSSFLTATPSVRSSPWSGVSPNLTGEQFFLFAGLIALGLTLIAAVDDCGWLNRGALAVSAIVIVIAVSAVIGQDDAIRAEASASQREIEEPTRGSYTMICSDGATVVCVHPAFEPMLDQASTQFNALLLTVGELPETPERINLLPVVSTTQEPGVWSHQLRAADPETDLRRAMHDLARELIAPASTASGAIAQNTILASVLLEAGRPVVCASDEAMDSGVVITPVSCDSLKHLTSMEPSERSAWLTNNMSAIRSGTIILDDLPPS